MCRDICSKCAIITLILENQSVVRCHRVKFNLKTDYSAHYQVFNLQATSSYESTETLMPQRYLCRQYPKYKLTNSKDQKEIHKTCCGCYHAPPDFYKVVAAIGS